MSIRLMNQVRESGLSKNEKAIARELADWATDEGLGIYPSVARVAWSTGYSERSVQRIIKILVDAKILILAGIHPQYSTNEYRMDTDALPERPSFREFMMNRKKRGGSGGGDILTGGDTVSGEGVTECPEGGDTVSPDPLIDPLKYHPLEDKETEGGETAVSGDPTYEEYESLFVELFPGKAVPRDGTQRRKALVKKWRKRLEDPFFAENWEEALRVGSECVTLHRERFWKLEYLVSNDSNIDKVIDRWMEWKDPQYQNGRPQQTGEKARIGGRK